MVRRLAAATALAALLVSSPAAVAEPARHFSYLPIQMGSDSTGTSVVVEKGDHLWKISATHLKAVLGRNPEPSELSPYWREVIAANHETLKSGNPDLIYPGEVVVLPERASVLGASEGP